MKRGGERGNSTVEFAFAAMALLLFVFGILEFGRALYTYHTVSNLARLGTRWAIVRGSGCTTQNVLDNCPATQAEVQTYVQSQAFALMNTGNITAVTQWPGTPTATCTNGSNGRGCLVTVTVSYPFQFWVPLIGSQGPTISSTSQMIISN